MADNMKWLAWARELQAIAQTGLHFSRDPYDRDRYEKIRKLAARIMAAHSGGDTAMLDALFAEQTGYATPRVGVRGAVIRDGKILLVREIMDGGRWTLPGGWADPNQSPSEAVAREVWEETGYEVKVQRLVGVYDQERHLGRPVSPFHIYQLFFLCEITGGAPSGSVETEMPTFFAEGEIPELSPARTLPFQIARMFEHARDPALPCYCD